MGCILVRGEIDAALDSMDTWGALTDFAGFGYGTELCGLQCDCRSPLWLSIVLAFMLASLCVEWDGRNWFGWLVYAVRRSGKR